MKCDKCGFETVENTNFCPNCGNHLIKDQEVTKEEETVVTVEREEKPLLKGYPEPFSQNQETQKKKFSLFNFSVILIVFLIRFTFAFINNELDTSYGTGVVLGNFAIILLISGTLLFFINNLGSKKKYIIISILVMLYFSYLLGNQILVINHEKELDELALEVDSFLVDTARDFYSGKPISKSKLNEEELGEFYEFSSLAVKYFEDFDVISQQIAFKEETKLDYLYSGNLPDNIVDQMTLLKSLKENISRLVKTSNDLEALVNNFVADTNDLIEKEKTEQVKTYMIDFLVGFNEAATPSNEVDATIIKTYTSYCDILEFLISKETEYYIEDNQFFFNTQEDVDKFNDLIQSFITNYEKFN